MSDLETNFHFLGRNEDSPNPCSPNIDESSCKKTALVLTRRYCNMPNAVTMLPMCAHTGKIHLVKDGTLVLQEDPSHAYGSLHLLDEVVILSGDAVVVDSKNLARPCVLQLRTRDCVPLLGMTDDGIYFAAHLSAETLFGFTSTKKSAFEQFKGSLLNRLFANDAGVDPAKCDVFVGPAISGLQNNCWCYEYTETPEQKDGSLLLNCISKEYPNLNTTDFVRIRPKDGKIDVNFGHLIRSILELHGIRNIDTSENHCTACNSSEFYSDRAFRRPDASTEEQQLLAKKVANIGLVVIQPT